MGGQSDSQKYQVMWKINERDEQHIGSTDCQLQLCSYFFTLRIIHTVVTDNLYFFTVVHISQQDAICKEKDEGTYYYCAKFKIFGTNY